MGNVKGKKGDSTLHRRLFRDAAAVSEEDVIYFRNHPNEIDEIASPVNIHRIFLLLGFLVGAVCVAVSKFAKHGHWLSAAHPAVEEFLIDVVFEIGVALIGAAIVTYILVIVLNEQQIIARKWRSNLRKKIRDAKALEDQE